MKIAHNQRRLIAWLLYSCVLFSTFACAIGHGQSSGLQLSGIQQLQCSIAGASDSRVPPLSQSTVIFECPLCGNHALTSSVSGYRLQLPVWHADAPLLSTAVSLPPQLSPWPAANPRAPPVLSC
jgi:predicted RNA-binding Zn-ribbon protein involved in translation (DUF1610 family)